MQATQVHSNIAEFHRNALADSNVITTENLMQTLQGHADFDWEEFNKPYREVDFAKVAKSVNQQFLSAIWTQKAGKTQTKQAIQTYEMKKGHVLGVGSSSNKNNNLLLIRNINSQWCSHSFAFADDTLKKQLNEDLQAIYGQELPIADMRNLSKMTVNFNVCSETSDLQNPETMEQLKYVALLKELLTLQIGQAHDPKLQIPQHVADGIIKTKYDEKQATDITKLQLSSSILKIKGADWIEPMTIIDIQNPDEAYSPDKGIQLKVIDDFKSINQAMKLLQNRNLDVIVQFDNSNVKKDGKRLIIIPKMKIVQVIVRGGTSNSNKTFGLNIAKFLAKPAE